MGRWPPAHRVSTTPGVAFDVGQRLSNSERNRLRNSAVNSGLWSYVEPASLTPTWVHFDKRFRQASLWDSRIYANKAR